jgi:hypothetical protein
MIREGAQTGLAVLGTSFCILGCDLNNKKIDVNEAHAPSEVKVANNTEMLCFKRNTESTPGRICSWGQSFWGYQLDKDLTEHPTLVGIVQRSPVLGKQIKIVPSSSSPESDTQESPSVPVPAGSKAPPSKKVKRSQSEQDTLRPTLA